MTAPLTGDSANVILLGRAIGHAVLTERFKNHEARRILRVLDEEVLPDLAARLAGRLENIATRGFDVGPQTTARLRFLYRDLGNFFDDLARRLRTETEDQLVDYATAQAAQLARDVRREVGTLASVVTPSTGAIRAAVLGRPFAGSTLRDRWGSRAASFRSKVEAQVRIGLVQGEVPAQIVRRVRALWPAERRKVASTVGSAVRHAQAQARQATYEENRGLLAGVMWVATLDVSTCPVCGGLDGKVLPVDSGPRPPLHPGPCRCATVPILKSAKDLGGTRASMDGQVPKAVKWAEWIGSQSADRQDEILGVGVAKLFRAGRIDVGDLVDGAGHAVTLERLAELSAR